MRISAGTVALGAVGALLLGIGSAGSAEASAAVGGCITSSNGFTFDCATGVLSWNNTVTIAQGSNQGKLFDASTVKQTRIALKTLPLGNGPGSVTLASPTDVPCLYQWDVAAQKVTEGAPTTPAASGHFVAGARGTKPSCHTTPPPTTTSTTAPPTTTTTAPPTTTTTAPPTTTTSTRTSTTAPPSRTTTTTTTPPSTTTSTSAVEAASASTYTLLPVNAGATAADEAVQPGATLSTGKALLILVALFALWLAFGAPRARLQHVTATSRATSTGSTDETGSQGTA